MWKREIYDFIGSDSHGAMSLRSLSEIERHRAFIECFFVKDAVHIEGETSRYDSTADTGTIITRYFAQTVVAAFLVQAVRIRASSALRQVHWTIVHGSNQMPLSIIKKNQRGISWMKVFLFLRICCQHKYRNSSLNSHTMHHDNSRPLQAINARMILK